MIRFKVCAPLMLVAAAAAAASTARAQSDWLSTPESIAEFRGQVESMKPKATQFELARVDDRTIALGQREIAIRIYDPGGEAPKPALIYVHGACWVAGSLDSHDEVSRFLASKSGAVVIALDYRLAPEHPYPAAHDDVFDTLVWVRDHADELGIDAGRLAISGESAGAHLAAATAIRVMDESDAPELAFQLLVYAALDGGGSSWPQCKDRYFPSKEDVRSRYGSPLWVEDLKAMPTTFNVFGQHESSRAEQELFVHKLREDGVEVQSFMVPGVGHDVQNWLPVTGDLAAHKAAIDFIRRGFAASE